MFDVVHMFSERGISAVPILDEDGVVINLYETVDVIVSISVFTVTLVNGLRLDPGSSRRLPFTRFRHI